MDIINVGDLPESLRSTEMIDDMVAGANAKAVRVAPCLTSDDPSPSDGQTAEARLVLLGAVKRWAEAGAGGLQQEQAGPYMQMLDTRQRSGFNLWPSEITSLQDICKNDDSSGAFSVDTAPSLSGQHAPWCSLMFGADYCSCGADIAGEPIYELG